MAVNKNSDEANDDARSKLVDKSQALSVPQLTLYLGVCGAASVPFGLLASWATASQVFLGAMGLVGALRAMRGGPDERN